ncbi:hypothetical protein [Pelagicoccus mobilis]|uniref:DUF4347 domain-containing protein n=1 Tax=Pelagicoccus mobilis TaxID=415221 RepID=A0A934RXA8_9BACT|nr:hypothetical protein [Pelagicoccus mobilis]MBK1876929.1 hypothetical protein [Pelagicoccus mobilis]
MLRLLALSYLTLFSSSLSATPLTSLDDTPTRLADQLQSPATLVLIVHEKEELPDAQRLLTLAFAQKHPAVILINLPQGRLHSTAIRRAANSFFQSEFSRSRTYFIEQSDNPYPKSKTLILSPDKPSPHYTSPTYPSQIPKSPSIPLIQPRPSE